MSKFDLDDTAPDWDSSSEDSNLEQKEEHNATEHYVAVGKSSLRNNLELAMDPKYNGEKVSRKDLGLGIKENDELKFSNDDDSEIVSIQDGSSEIGIENEAYEDSENDHDKFEEIVEKEDEKKLVRKMNLVSNKDAEKGQHVRSQLSLWDGFLDLRIRTQKIIEIANSMPQGETYDKLTEDEETQESIDQASIELLEMFDCLVTFQKDILEPEQMTCDVNLLKRKRQGNINEMIESCWEDVLKPMEIGFGKYRDETIEKWNTKVQMSSGELAQKKFKVINQSVVAQIQSSMSNPEKLIKRTQLNRSGIKVIGKVLKQNATPLDSEETSNNKHLDDFDTEIFDDGDYYQQLLKELIESRMSDTSDPVLLGLRYAQLKQLQKKKTKKNIDTRASKGRKVRYQVHEKIQNFMTPEPRGTWHEEMKNELFMSLFGKKDQRTDLLQINDGFKLF